MVRPSKTLVMLKSRKRIKERRVKGGFLGSRDHMNLTLDHKPRVCPGLPRTGELCHCSAPVSFCPSGWIQGVGRRALQEKMKTNKTMTLFGLCLIYLFKCIENTWPRKSICMEAGCIEKPAVSEILHMTCRKY